MSAKIPSGIRRLIRTPIALTLPQLGIDQTTTGRFIER
jgi:hypothetical protein